MRIVAGRWRGRRLPEVESGVRPVGARLKTSLFSVLGGIIEGAHVLDLCAGSGGFGLEALSRGAQSVTFVDHNRRVLHALETWLHRVDPSAPATFVVGDALHVVPGKALDTAYDVVFVDPPYEAWSSVDAAAWRAVGGRYANPLKTSWIAYKLPKTLEFSLPDGARSVREQSAGDTRYLVFALGPDEAG